MQTPIWLEFGGSPPILMDRILMPQWHGFYLPATSENAVPDLELPEGNYVFDDTFDFDNPRTDYDRACNPLNKNTHQLISIGNQDKAIVFCTESSPITYIESLNSFVWLHTTENPDGWEDDLLNASSANLEWKDEIEWEINDTSIVLFNSALHGSDPDMGEDDCMTIFKPKGKYSLSSSTYQTTNALWCFVRLIRSN